MFSRHSSAHLLPLLLLPPPLRRRRRRPESQRQLVAASLRALQRPAAHLARADLMNAKLLARPAKRALNLRRRRRQQWAAADERQPDTSRAQVAPSQHCGLGAGEPLSSRPPEVAPLSLFCSSPYSPCLFFFFFFFFYSFCCSSSSSSSSSSDFRLANLGDPAENASSASSCSLAGHKYASLPLLSSSARTQSLAAEPLFWPRSVWAWRKIAPNWSKLEFCTQRKKTKRTNQRKAWPAGRMLARSPARLERPLHSKLHWRPK